MKYRILSIKYFKYISFLVILYTCFFILNTQIANAESTSLRLSPSLLQIRTETTPYETAIPLTIENLADRGVNLKPQIKLFRASDLSNGQVEYLDELSQDTNFLNNIRIIDDRGVINEIILGPKQKKIVQLKISLPGNQKASDYYFSVIFISKPYIQSQASQSSAQNTFSSISEGIAVNTLLSVGPRSEEKVSIEEFSVAFLLEKGPVPFSIRVKNNGNHFISPTGNILIKNMFGQKIGKVYLPAQNILANSSRYLLDSNMFSEIQLNNQREKAQDTNAIWPEKFLLGPYSAELTLELSDGQTVTRKTTFFAFPVKLFVSLMLGAILLLLIYKRVKYKMAER